MERNDKLLAIAKLAGQSLELAQVALKDLSTYKIEIEKLEKSFPNDAELGKEIRKFIRVHEGK